MKLATIQKIIDVRKHENADALDMVTVLGWHVVSKIGEFTKGDLCVYIALDSVVPETTAFEFLRSSGFRIRSVKLRGKISQGIVFPVSLLDGLVPKSEQVVGLDVTDVLGVKKYEKPPPQHAGAIGDFPTHIVSHTDEERVQNLPEIVEKFIADKTPVDVTIKHDGTSATYINDNSNIRVCSRNLELSTDRSVYTEVVKDLNLIDSTENGDVIQGEVIGPGIQKNKEALKRAEIRVFNVFVGGKLLSPEDTDDYCESRGITQADKVYRGPFKWNSLQELLDEANATRYKNGSRAEGIVIRPLTPQYSEELGKDLSVKVISNEFALKHGE